VILPVDTAATGPMTRRSPPPRPAGVREPRSPTTSPRACSTWGRTPSTPANSWARREQGAQREGQRRHPHGRAPKRGRHQATEAEEGLKKGTRTSRSSASRPALQRTEAGHHGRTGSPPATRSTPSASTTTIWRSRAHGIKARGSWARSTSADDGSPDALTPWTR